MGGSDPSNQLEAELASNLPREMCKMIEYDIAFVNFRFLAWPSTSDHGEYVHICIYGLGHLISVLGASWGSRRYGRKKVGLESAQKQSNLHLVSVMDATAWPTNHIKR